MRNSFSTVFKAAIIAMAVVILTGCNYTSQFAAHAGVKDGTKRAAWLTYWDLDAGEKDLAEIGSKLSKLSYFGAYFDKDDRLFVPADLSERRFAQKKKKVRYETYLTFVNDKQNPDGSVVMKDIEVLRRMFVSDTVMERHIDEIIELTLQGGYDGIEMDYERIWKDAAIGKEFLHFSDKLYEKARKNNLKLRIVLEPSTPFSSLAFVKGPEYVVMAYNYYGLHSSPGPKANKEFICKLITRMSVLPGEKSVAYSTGGCLWGDNGVKKFVTEDEAQALAMLYGAEPIRDEESQCLIFDYQDKGVAYKVWYADVKTLNYWIAIAQEKGETNISLWRLGGNSAIHKLE